MLISIFHDVVIPMVIIRDLGFNNTVTGDVFTVFPISIHGNILDPDGETHPITLLIPVESWNNSYIIRHALLWLLELQVEENLFGTIIAARGDLELHRDPTTYGRFERFYMPNPSTIGIGVEPTE
jgi:hypothetical protein